MGVTGRRFGDRGRAVARVAGLGWRAGIAAALSLLVTAAVLVVVLTAAAGNRAAGDELSARLVPAAAASGALLDGYTAAQSALRDYVTSGQPAALGAFRQASAAIAGQQARVARLVHGYPLLPASLAAAGSAYRQWRARVAGPQLAAAGRGDFARARALQADITAARPYTLAVRARMAALQAQITSRQALVTGRLLSGQRVVLAALAALCAVAALITAGSVLVVRRWLLRPFTALRSAADRVAAGDYGTRVPAVGPAELADLGRSTELMRTRLVAALAEAEQAEDTFRRLFDSSPDATLTIAADGTIFMANAQASRMFGYSTAELAGQPVEILVPAALREIHSGKLAGYLAAPRPRPMSAGLELSAVRKDGREFPVEISLSPLPSTTVVASASIRDISERLAAQADAERLRAEADRERYQRRLEASQKLESLGQLVGGVAHDFNNLLNIISGYAAFITEQVTGLAGGDPRLATVLGDAGQVQRAAERAAALTRQLLIFARRDVVHPQVLDIGAVVSGIEHMLRRTLGEHIELVTSLAPGLWPVYADSGQLDQVLVNLAVNASDAMPRGGKLTIDTANITVDDTYAAAQPGLSPGRHVRLRVCDTGTGMAPEVAARVFEPFYTTKPPGKGTGLGLATVHGIISQAGGYAQIYSEPGMGTTVTVLLPATSQAAEAAPAPAAAPARGHGETILLAEDEEDLAALVHRILVRNGYHVLAATSPEAALRHASDFHQAIDLLLTDAVMPGMLGNEVASRARALRPGLPVLYMSGYAQPILDTQGALDPHASLLEKPFSEITLLTRVGRALGSHPGPDTEEPPHTRNPG
jgi:PAS domain S-box-containing protein